jgi:hypothetical protein
MPVPMMQVRIVRVFVAHWRVSMPVRMGLAKRIVRPMDVLVVLIVGMTVFVIKGLVGVLVLVAFGKMKVHAYAH